MSKDKKYDPGARYADWRPSHSEVGKDPEVAKKRRVRQPPEPRSFTVRLLRKVVLVAVVLLLLTGPFGDYLNGHVKADDGCRVQSLVDGDTVRLTCPGQDAAVVDLAGFDAPELFSPQCWAEVKQGFGATYALRKVLFTASSLSFVAVASNARAVVPDDATTGDQPVSDNAEQSGEVSEAAPDASVEAAAVVLGVTPVRALADGKDIANAMVAAGWAKPGSNGSVKAWCE